MKASDKLAGQLKRHEGERLTVYLCTNKKLSIGVGRNLEERGISEAESQLMLQNDIEYFTDAVIRNIDVSYCNEVRIAVLINMAFNLGIQGLLGFKKTIAAIERGDFDYAAVEMLDSKWAREDVSIERSSELSNQLKTGEWQQ